MPDFHPLNPAVSWELSHHWYYRGLEEPRINVEFRRPGPAPRRELVGLTWALVIVDSGSRDTILPKRFAKPLRIDLNDDEVEDIGGAGGIRVPCYPSVDLVARLCGQWIPMPVRFFATENRKGGLLGRTGAFKALRIAFDHSQELIYAAPVITDPPMG